MSCFVNVSISSPYSSLPLFDLHRTFSPEMQALEKALHQPMPFTTGGQTINDRLTAAKHALAGSQLGKTICKATTEELMAPKKKHCDYLLHCTNEPNVSIPSMANLLIERTQNPNWIVVYKALITIHNLMCYGNERFSQYLASCNTTFNLTSFVDRSGLQGMGVDLAAGYDMSTHVRRYAKYISEKIHTYRLCAFDFCKVKRGREDGLLRAMHTDKLLKTLPILQNQIDALLEFQVTSSELNNGVINCSFILLFRDLIRLFACYNDGVINLLEKFFDMNKRQCREALDMYKGFLYRLDKVSDFLRVAESVGIDRGEIPDLTRAPASLLEALEAHLYHLEGGRGPPPSVTSAQQMINTYQQQSHQPAVDTYGGGGAGAYAGGNNPFGGPVDESAKQRYLEEEKQRLMQYEAQRRQQQQQTQPPGGGAQPQPASPPANNPFSASGGGGNPDLLSFLEAPGGASQQSNPFAFAQQPAAGPPPAFNPFGAAAGGGGNGAPMHSTSQPAPFGGGQSNPFGAPAATGGQQSFGGMYPSVQQPWLNPMGAMYGQQPPFGNQWGAPGGAGGYGAPQPPAPPQMWNAFGAQQPSVVYGQPSTIGYGMSHQQPQQQQTQNQFAGGQTGARDPFGSFS